MNETTIHVKTTPKDFFLNLGAIITLYISTVSFISLAYVIINHFFPDALAYYYDGNRDTIRWTISCLVILFPLHVFLVKLISKDIALIPEKKYIWVKRWAVYLTLFIAGATAAGDLIILLNYLLGGEITTRFILKVITVLAAAAYIFVVYLHDLKRNDYGKDTFVSGAALLGAGVTLAAIITGFMIVGSPIKERDQKFDDQRVSDLSSIQDYIVNNYWTRTGELPQSLGNLKDPLSSYLVVNDPETNQPYEYMVTGPTSFKLCATFSLPSREDENQIRYGMLNQSFKHGVGNTCFDRTIDPKLYPVMASSTKK